MRWYGQPRSCRLSALPVSGSTGPGSASSRWLIDASYVMLRNASLGYNFNKDVVKTVGVSSLKLFVSGENLWLSSKRKGLEPYQNFAGTTQNRYTPSRIITFGLSTTF